MEAREDNGQVDAMWDSLSGPEWHSDSSNPDTLEDLDLLQWAPLDQLLVEGSLLPSANLDCSPDDLLPTMLSLMDTSDVSAASAYPASNRADSADSSLFSYLDATMTLCQPEAQTNVCSIQLQSASSTAAAVASPHQRELPSDLPRPSACGMPDIPSATDMCDHGCELPITAMQDTGFTVHRRPISPRASASPCLLPALPYSGTASTSSQLDTAALWASDNGGGFSSCELSGGLAFSTERLGSSASNDSSGFGFEYSLAGPAAAGAAAVAMPPARNPQRPARVASAGAACVPAGRQIRRPTARPRPAAPGRARLRAHSPDPEYLPAGAASRQRVSWVVTAARSGMLRPRAAAGAPTAAADAPAARPTAAERNRQVQREYLERKQARTEAVYAQVSELEARRAELQAQLGPLLARHEQLTRSLPWHEQTEEWSFMASIASCAPGGADEADTPDQAPLPDLIQSMMLEPDATVEHLYASADLHDTAEDESAVFKPLCLMPAPKPTCSSPWQRLVAKLQLTRAQREGIAAGYEHHIQSEAFLHEDCLGIAAKLQKLPRLVGDLTDSLKPNLATCAIGCQLAAIAQRGEGLTQQLTRTCFQVFSGAQMKILCELVSVLPLDVRGLCREIAATGPAKRRVQSAPITRLISPAAHSRKRAAARRIVTEQDTITADVASDDARGNAPNVVPQKRRSAGPSSPQDIDKVKKRRER